MNKKSSKIVFILIANCVMVINLIGNQKVVINFDSLFPQSIKKMAIDTSVQLWQRIFFFVISNENDVPFNKVVKLAITFKEYVMAHLQKTYNIETEYFQYIVKLIQKKVAVISGISDAQTLFLKALLKEIQGSYSIL